MTGDPRLLWRQVVDVLRRGAGWWLSTLADSVPRRLRVALGFAPRYRMSWRRGDSPLIALATDGRDVSGPAGINRSCVVELVPPAALVRTIELPRAARAFLGDAVRLKLRSLVPMPADRLVVGWRVQTADGASTKLAVVVAVARRDEVERALSEARDRGLQPVAVVAATETADRAPVMLLRCSPEGRLRPASRAAGAVVALAAALAVAAVAHGHGALQAQLEEATRRLEAARTGAEVVIARRDAVEARLGQLRELVDGRRQRPTVLTMLAALTRALPDDVWIEELRLDDDALLLSGRARSAAGLIGLLEAEPLLRNVGFADAVTVDPSSGEERFQVVAQLGPVEEPGDGR